MLNIKIITKLEFKSENFKLFKKFIFDIFLYKLFLVYKEMPKKFPAKYYQEKEKRLLKKPRERYQNLSKEEKTDSMVANITKIFQKVKTKVY